MVDLALYWTKPSPMGSNVDSVVEASLEVIEAARGAGLPIFFSTWDFDPDVRSHPALPTHHPEGRALWCRRIRGWRRPSPAP